MKNAPDLTIIVITFNNEKFLPGFFNSLKNTQIRINTELILIDNASTDKTKEILEQHSKDINVNKIIYNTQNKGFAKAVNKGIHYSKSEFVLLLNPDSIIPKNSIEKIYKFILSDKNLAVAGGALKDLITKKNQPSHLMSPSLMMTLFEFTNLKKIFPNNPFSKKLWYENIKPSVKKKLNVDAVCGAFMIIRKKAAEKVGYFDENFFMYLEDLDFCIRIKKAGYEIGYTNESKIFHFSGGSSLLINPKNRINENAWKSSRKYFFRKYNNLIIGYMLEIIFRSEDLILDLRKMLIDKS